MKPSDFAACFTTESGKPVLNAKTRKHLFASAMILNDEINTDWDNALRHPRDHPWDHVVYLEGMLPELYEATYDFAFFRKFRACYSTVLYKLGCRWSALACVGEELALNALIMKADQMRDVFADEGQNVAGIDWQPIWDLAYQDLDFEWLFKPRYDGIQHHELIVASDMGMANMDRSQWFDRFGGAPPPHPLTWRD